MLRCEAAVPKQLGGDALFAGLYLNELLIRTLSQEEPVAALFNDYGDALASLNSVGAEGDLEPILRTFERRLLEELATAWHSTSMCAAACRSTTARPTA